MCCPPNIRTLHKPAIFHSTYHRKQYRSKCFRTPSCAETSLFTVIPPGFYSVALTFSLFRRHLVAQSNCAPTAAGRFSERGPNRLVERLATSSYKLFRSHIGAPAPSSGRLSRTCLRDAPYGRVNRVEVAGVRRPRRQRGATIAPQQLRRIVSGVRGAPSRAKPKSSPEVADISGRQPLFTISA